MVKFWNSCISEWEVQLTLNKGGGSRSFMTMTVTIWWPRSGVSIYQIVTGVTSNVGVPSTHLVYLNLFTHFVAKENNISYLLCLFTYYTEKENISIIFWYSFTHFVVKENICNYLLHLFLHSATIENTTVIQDRFITQYKAFYVCFIPFPPIWERLKVDPH